MEENNSLGWTRGWDCFHESEDLQLPHTSYINSRNKKKRRAERKETNLRDLFSSSLSMLWHVPLMLLGEKELIIFPLMTDTLLFICFTRLPQQMKTFCSGLIFRLKVCISKPGTLLLRTRQLLFTDTHTCRKFAFQVLVGTALYKGSLQTSDTKLNLRFTGMRGTTYKTDMMLMNEREIKRKLFPI